MLNEVLLFVPALIAGLTLGAFFFGGLWWTVKRLPDARRPALLTLGSLIARLGMTLLALYLVTDGHLAKIVVFLLGFLLARTILIYRWRPATAAASATSLLDESRWTEHERD